MKADFYATLGIKRSASHDEVKAAFRTLAKKHHPDHGGDTETFKKISEAYSTLANPVKRRSYDFDHPATASVYSAPTMTENEFWRKQQRKWAPDDATMRAAQKAFDDAMEEMQTKYRNANAQTYTHSRPINIDPGTFQNVTFTRSSTVKPHEVYYDPITKQFRTRPKL